MNITRIKGRASSPAVGGSVALLEGYLGKAVDCTLVGDCFFLKTPISIQIKSIPFFCSSFFLCLQGQPELCGATIFSSLAFLSLSVSMAKLSCLVAASFSSLTLLSSSVSTANITTTLFSLSFLSNSFSSQRFNLLSVARRCFSWSSCSDDLSFPLVVFLVLLLALSFSRLILSFSFLCSSVSEALFTVS